MSTVVIRAIQNESGDMTGKYVFTPSAIAGAFAGVELDAGHNVVAHLIAKQFSNAGTELSYAGSHVHLAAETYADRQELQDSMPLATYLDQHGATLAGDLRAALQGIATGNVQGAHTAAVKPPSQGVSASR